MLFHLGCRNQQPAPTQIGVDNDKSSNTMRIKCTAERVKEGLLIVIKFDGSMSRTNNYVSKVKTISGDVVDFYSRFTLDGLLYLSARLYEPKALIEVDESAAYFKRIGRKEWDASIFLPHGMSETYPPYQGYPKAVAEVPLPKIRSIHVEIGFLDVFSIDNTADLGWRSAMQFVDPADVRSKVMVNSQSVMSASCQVKEDIERR